MQNRDSYKLLYNNLWLHKSGSVKTTAQTATLSPAAVAATPRAALIDLLQNPVFTENTKNKDSEARSVPEVHEHRSRRYDAVVSDKDAGYARGLIDNWDTLVDNITNCSKCNLCHSRQNVVIERGSRAAKWMFIGEGPGEQEDIQGKPFVGASGQLLQKMITAMQLDPAQDVYICNVVKCRPPSNRNPEANEIELCKNYLFSQIALIKPQIIITLGRFAYQTLLNTDVALGKLRLKQHHYQQIPLIVTYHPAYLLRNPSAKKDAWADLQLAMQIFKDTKEHVIPAQAGI